MKKNEKSIVVNFRVPVKLNEKIEEYIENNGYSSLSDFLRIACDQLMKYHDYEDRFNDPKVREEFIQKIDPEILKHNQDNAMIAHFQNLSEEELERFYYELTKERSQRQKNKIELNSQRKIMLRNGGEPEPKVGYALGITQDIEFYRPITPNSKEWGNLSKEDKNHLLKELKQKRADLETLLPEPEKNPPEYRFLILDRIIREINERIDDEL